MAENETFSVGFNFFNMEVYYIRLCLVSVINNFFSITFLSNPKLICWWKVDLLLFYHLWIVTFIFCCQRNLCQRARPPIRINLYAQYQGQWFSANCFTNPEWLERIWRSWNVLCEICLLRLIYSLHECTWKQQRRTNTNKLHFLAMSNK